MKKLILLLFFFSSLNAQNKIPICGGSPNSEFIRLSEHSTFAGKHEIPEPIQEFKGKGDMIKFAVKGGGQGSAYRVAHRKSNKWLLVFQEWWGLNDYIKRESDRYFEALGDVNVLAIDLYDGNVADNREDAQKYMRSVNEERIKSLIEGAMAHAGENAEFSSIGWCFGGGWSLKSALIGMEKSKKCVIYYGWPETDPGKLSVLNASVLGVFGTRDKGISQELVAEFESGMKKAGKSVEILKYDADHAFANPSSPRYNEKAAQEAYQKTLEFLKGD